MRMSAVVTNMMIAVPGMVLDACTGSIPMCSISALVVSVSFSDHISCWKLQRRCPGELFVPLVSAANSNLVYADLFLDSHGGIVNN